MGEARKITPVSYDFQCAPSLKLEAHERVSALQIAALNERIDRLNVIIERMEKRLWITVYGVVGVILAQAFQSIIERLP
ncbi:GTA head formation protein, RCAP_rcc01685 family [Pseudooceanicola algae]|uniref:Gene transfer agent protein n=1 Tax=Pseudooceanicola algae TaxID=1537215 RepID=A0A418SC07_9RHOB|nr:hypothetical protein [Pseudooceanicola algae]QPM89929.1 hypothetical protein PSAL_011590 [Pseudooceanicola algae]